MRGVTGTPGYRGGGIPLRTAVSRHMAIYQEAQGTMVSSETPFRVGKPESRGQGIAEVKAVCGWVRRLGVEGSWRKRGQGGSFFQCRDF